MAGQTTIGLVAYYANLLIRQYITQPRAYATIAATTAKRIQPMMTVETISFNPIPTSGTWDLEYEGNVTTFNWNSTALDVQTWLRLLPPGIIYGGQANSTGYHQIINGGNAAGWGTGAITVTGSIASGLLTVSFVGIDPPAGLLSIPTSALLAGTASTIPVVTEIDVTLPIAVQNAFNMIGPDTAVGKQLDIIGKYCGVTRTAQGFTQQITLDDTDFKTVIQMAQIQNSSGSSLATIQAFLHQFFPNQVLAFDNQNMTMNYFVSSVVGSQELIQVIISEKLLPKPMAVQIASIIYAPVIDKFFGMRLYQLPAVNNTPFNTYQSYDLNAPWLDYRDAIIF